MEHDLEMSAPVVSAFASAGLTQLSVPSFPQVLPLTLQNVAVAAMGIIALSVAFVLLGVFIAMGNGTGARILRLASPEAKMLTFATVCLFASTATGLVLPYAVGVYVDSLSGNAASRENRDERSYAISILLLSTAGSMIFGFFRGSLYTLAGERIVCRLRKDLFGALVLQDIAFFDEAEHSSGSLQSRLSSDTATLQNAASVNISMALRFVANFIVTLIVLVMMSWQLTAVMIATVPPVSCLAAVYGRLARRLAKDHQDALAEAGRVSSEALQAIRTVRAFATGDVTERARYSHHIDIAYRAGYWQSWVYGGWTGLVGMLFMFAVIGVLVVGGHLVERGELTAGSLLSFLLYTVNLAATVGGIAGLFAQLMQAVGSSQKVFDLLDWKPQVGLDEGTDILRLLGKVEFRDVTFAYPTRPGALVLDKVSFTAEPDQVLALVGASGSGKSTVISLLLRFYDPDQGVILVDGEDSRNIAPRALYRHMALVAQEPVLFSQTILENIVYGRVGLPQDDIDVALEQASAKFVYDFQEGLATQVGERGIQLSGGQKQRLAIARALLVHPSLLLLDEATSALDAESEHEVQRALDKLVARKCQTVILIAHRLSTVRNADAIVVLDKGVAVEKGKHEELMLKKGVYSRLIARQLNA